jgi:hypothetical protein
MTETYEQVVIGRIYNRTKTTQGGDRKSKGQSGPLKSTAKKVADEYDIGENTVKRIDQSVKSVP